MPDSEYRDFELECVVKRALWCPNPESASQLQTAVRVVLNANGVCVERVRKPKRGSPVIGYLDPSDAQRLRPILVGGGQPDVDILDSDPKAKKVLLSIFVSEDDLFLARRAAQLKKRSQIEAIESEPRPVHQGNSVVRFIRWIVGK